MTPASRAPVRPWLLVAAGWLVMGLVAAAQTTLFSRLESGRALDLPTALLVTVPGWLVYALATPAVAWRVRREPFAAGRRTRAALWHLGLALLVALVHATVVATCNLLGFPQARAERTLAAWVGLILANRIILELVVYAAIAGVVLAWDALRQLRAREVAAAALEAQLARAQLQALQGQLQPHFLFNTLNAIGVLVREDAAAAGRMISLLANLLRRTLDAAQQQEVPLREELEFLERYLEIERTRFPDRLRTAIEVPGALLGVRVPSFVLQPLVENAVRHGIAPRPEGGRVVVRARREGALVALEVWNDGAPLAAGRRDGIGLTATRERLARLYGEAGTLTLSAADGGVLARVTLPAPEGE
ncbi:MAG TPA: histidine kinase [Gemmatimonadales bacterium]|nr:histidine kinase [Gemmatimonadales bacterium]